MTEKSFEFYLERALKSINDGKPPKEWRRNALAWEVRDKAYQLMIDDIFKDRVKKKYDELIRKCAEEEYHELTKEGWEETKKDEEKKKQLRDRIMGKVKDRFYDYLIKD